MASECECRGVFSAIASVIYVKARAAIVAAPEIVESGRRVILKGAQPVQDAFVQGDKSKHVAQRWLGAPAGACVSPFAYRITGNHKVNIVPLENEFGIPLLFDVPPRELVREAFADKMLATGIAYITASMIAALLDADRYQSVGLFIRCACGECGCTGRFFIAFTLGNAEAK
jgi:hypothetical protein